MRSGLGGPLLRVGYLKAFMDGTLGSETARMLDGSGVEITSREAFEQYIRDATRAGFPVAVHAIGDLANREALDAFEATRELWQPLGLRQRIEHAQLLAPEDVPRFAELGIAASVQFTHAPSDRDLADRFWGGLDSEPYAFRSLLDSGVVLANGSDAPIEELDPLLGIRAGVARTLDEREAWHPEQALTRRAGAARDDGRSGVARRRRAAAREARPRLPRRPRRARPRPARLRAGGARRGAGRGDDARRRLDTQPAALVRIPLSR